MLLPVYVELTGSRFLLTLFHPVSQSWRWPQFGLDPILWLWRDDELQSCRLSWDRRLCCRHFLPSKVSTAGFVQRPVALLVSAFFALVIGALSLRTRGVYFIMITLAFCSQWLVMSLPGWRAMVAMTSATIQKREPVHLRRSTVSRQSLQVLLHLPGALLVRRSIW